jgi:flagellar basal-body rod protein FlgF
MDNPGYVTLSRQSGLLRELTAIANNIANASTAGYRRESVLFAEHIAALEDGDPSLSIATLDRRYIDLSAGAIETTTGPLDFAIEGEGFFLVETPAGPQLTRAGSFTLGPTGELLTREGRRVLDQGGGAISLPPGAREIAGGADGTIAVDGQPIARLAVVAADEAFLVRTGDNLFNAERGFTPVETPRVRQFALEGSNVSPVAEIANLIEVQRAYESGARFVQDEHERIRNAVRELGQAR